MQHLGSQEKRAIFKKLNAPVDKLSSDILRFYIEECMLRGKTPQNVESIKTTCERVAKWFTNPECKCSLMLLGGVGTGKTTLLKAIKRALNEGRIYPWYVKSIDIPKKMSNDDDPDYIERLIRSPYLFIDDVGEEPTQIKVYGNGEIIFPRIIDYRYDNMLPTIITSNLSFSQDEKENSSFYSNYGIRVYDRMKEMFNRFVIDHDSYR